MRRTTLIAGLAVTLAPELLVRGLPGVAFVPLDDAVPHRSLYALTAASGVRPAARAFIAALERAAAGR